MALYIRNVSPAGNRSGDKTLEKRDFFDSKRFFHFTKFPERGPSSATKTIWVVDARPKKFAYSSQSLIADEFADTGSVADVERFVLIVII